MHSESCESSRSLLWRCLWLDRVSSFSRQPASCNSDAGAPLQHQPTSPRHTPRSRRRPHSSEEGLNPQPAHRPAPGLQAHQSAGLRGRRSSAAPCAVCPMRAAAATTLSFAAHHQQAASAASSRAARQGRVVGGGAAGLWASRRWRSVFRLLSLGTTSRVATNRLSVVVGHWRRVMMTCGVMQVLRQVHDMT